MHVLAKIAIVVLVVFACFIAGFRVGINKSPSRENLEGQIVFALTSYRALETTNVQKLHSCIDIQLVAYTREYERRFGVPNGTNAFDKRFAEAKEIADRVEKTLVPVGSGLQKALGTNYNVEMGK